MIGEYTVGVVILGDLAKPQSVNETRHRDQS